MAAVLSRITNTGTRVGKEVAQCYIHDVEASVYRPVHELRELCKIELKVGESRQVDFELPTEAFAFYDIGRKVYLKFALDRVAEIFAWWAEWIHKKESK